MNYKVEISICERDFEQIESNEKILANAENREPKDALDIIKDSVLLNIKKKASTKNIVINEDTISYEATWMDNEPDDDCPACRKLNINCIFTGELEN